MENYVSLSLLKGKFASFLNFEMFTLFTSCQNDIGYDKELFLKAF